MKFWFVLAILAMSSITLAQEKYRMGQSPVAQDPANYTIKVHIAATHLRHDCSGFGNGVSCASVLYADAVLDGRKVELSGAIDKRLALLIVPGDYFAALQKKSQAAGGGSAIWQQYNVLMPDKTAWRCTITGLSE